MKTIENLKELSDEQLEELRCDIENEQHKRIDKAIQARFVCPFCRETGKPATKLAGGFIPRCQTCLAPLEYRRDTPDKEQR